MKAEAQAPGKVILFGEHAINRGQPAIAASIGLYARCSIDDADAFHFSAGEHSRSTIREDVLQLTAQVDHMRSSQAFDEIRSLARNDYFAPQKYILGKIFADDLPRGMALTWQSDIPSSSGLGSGAAAFNAMITVLAESLPKSPSTARRAEWAELGDIIAHGGIASGLDTQTSLLGGVIRYAGQGLAEPLPCPPGACLLVAHSGIAAATSEVNSRVRLWLAEKPDSRIQYFQTIGALSRAAVSLLQKGDWEELGRLMNLNQLVLEKIGVSCPEIDRLIEAALSSGAFGAKISGSGGGGVVIVLAPEAQKDSIVQTLRAQDATVIAPELGVPGAKIIVQSRERALTAIL
jgi:mevalonate kinase